MTRVRPLLVAGVVAVLAAGCERQAARAACEAYWPDVPVRTLDAAAADRPPARLVELWRVAGAEGLELAAPASFAANRHGDLAIVDYMLAEVLILDSAGTVRRAPLRRGRGPGEVTMPVAANWQGDTLVVFDIEQAKLVSLPAGTGDHAGTDAALPGSFVTPVVSSGEIAFAAVAAGPAAILQYPPHPHDGAARTLAFVRATPGSGGAAITDTLVAADVRLVATADGRALVQPASAVPRVAAGADGWLAVSAPDGSYRVRVTAPDGGHVHQLCRAGEAAPLSAAERGLEAPRGFEEEAAAIAAAGAPAARAHVGRLLVGPAGEVWVATQRPAPFTDDALYGPMTPRLDVWSPDGAYRGSVVVPEGVRLQAVSRDRVWGLHMTPLDEPVVVAYRVEWQGS